MVAGLPTPQRDDSRTAVYYATTTPTTFYITSNFDSTVPRDYKPTYDELRMMQSLGQYLENSYKELMRMLNYAPSVDGVKTKKARFDELILQMRSLWVRAVRFDLRQPCWRAGRWKSLTA